MVGLFTYDGKDFSSYRKIADYAEVDYDNFLYYIKKDYTIEEAILSSRNNLTSESSSSLVHMYKAKNGFYMHGVLYRSFKDLTVTFGVDTVKFRNRKRKGWSIEECLEVKQRGSLILYKGQSFKFWDRLCDYAGIDFDLFFKLYSSKIDLDFVVENLQKDNLEPLINYHRGLSKVKARDTTVVSTVPTRVKGLNLSDIDNNLLKNFSKLCHVYDVTESEIIESFMKKYVEDNKHLLPKDKKSKGLNF